MTALHGSARVSRNRYYQGPPTDHFDGTLFHSPGAPPTDKSLGELWRFWRTPAAPWPDRIDRPEPAPLDGEIAGNRLCVTALGHASHLLQVGGLNILVDPVWSDRASPYAFAGPKRAVPPPYDLSALPRLDAILITHNHYDHLDTATLARLRERAPCRIVVPLGNDTILRRFSSALNAEAYDWGDRVALSPEVSATLLRCHHWSARWLGDRRMALWAAFAIEAPGGCIYHIGDTAFGDGRIFAEVQERFGRPRLAVLPIGAYEPRWFMRAQHVDPEEAVRIFQLCGARYAIGHHWGCFRLTTEPMDEPPRRLRAALEASAIETARFRALPPGEAFDVPPDP